MRRLGVAMPLPTVSQPDERGTTARSAEPAIEDTRALVTGSQAYAPEPSAEVTGRSKRLAHVHVVGLEFEQLGQRFRHGPEAATEVEPHGVLRWRRRDDHVGVAGGVGDLVELLGQAAADTRRT